MIYKCPNCNGALEYNPATDRMECEFCGNGFLLAEIEAAQQKVEHTYNQQSGERKVIVNGEGSREIRSGSAAQSEEPEVDFLANIDTMECNIYTCTSCGAELAVNDSEAATFCAYCGQPTVVFSRVSQELKPQSIVLFRINKEQAVNGIRERLKKSFFVPKEIKNFSVDKVRGIYIPNWVFDIHYYDMQHWEVTNSDNKTIKNFEREAECMLKGLTLDASKKLDDELSQRLEPFDVRTRKPFESGYLSGYYADKYDFDEDRMRTYAYWRAKQLFDAQIKETIPASNAQLKLSFPKRIIKNVEYTLLPVWFVTFRYNYENYTIAVNGQTGKVVGTVPYDKRKVGALFGGIAAGVALFITILGLFLMQNISNVIPGIVLLIISGVLLFIAILKMNKIKNAMTLTKAYETEEYVKERQDRI
ncbi:MAG: hypothetical protein IJ291_03920 [Lachnospiraceae bacterium]|nr:hypothetical protein [Lachnospiraceae bacterium]